MKISFYFQIIPDSRTFGLINLKKSSYKLFIKFYRISSFISFKTAFYSITSRKACTNIYKFILFYFFSI